MSSVTTKHFSNFVSIKSLHYSSKLFLVLAILFAASNCTRKNVAYPESVLESLEISGSNRPELELVLNHYASSEDTLKYKAAIFLISNMKYHYSYKPLVYANSVFDSIANIKVFGTKNINIWKRKDIFNKMLDSLNSTTGVKKGEIVCDAKLIRAEFLINNIDLAFHSWRKIPLRYRANFQDFCAYILPYKNSTEPLEAGLRQHLHDKYSWVVDSLKISKNTESIIDAVIDSLHFQTSDNIRKKYPITLAVSQVEKSRLGICQDGVNYFVGVFRAIGIKCSEDYVPHWGNHHSSGHSWMYIEYGTDTYVKDSSPQLTNDLPVDLKKLYKEESTPKVYRVSFNPTRIKNDVSIYSDVTKFYTDTYNPVIDIESNAFIKNMKPKICVFNANKEWVPVDEGNIVDGKVNFYNIGKNSIYIACFTNKQFYLPISYPFFFDENSNSTHILKPSSILEDSIGLLRKYPIARRDKRKLGWIEHLNGAKIQGSNTLDFGKYIELCTIAGVNSPQAKKILINTNRKFSFVRFYSSRRNCSIGELTFYNKQGKPLHGVMIKSNLSWVDSLNDNKPWTSFGGFNSFVGLHLSHPESIGSVMVQARSDGNHIRVGNKYELLYWGNQWISLGEKVANDTVLYYKHVPKNSLLLLKNRTEGNEEHVFILNNMKKQKWVGSL